MDCPKCKETMIILELNQVEIDYCTICKGIWLDAGELEALLNNAGDKDKLLHSFRQDNSTNEKARKCPICTKKMNKVLIGDENPVLVDECKNYHGIWFDDGELHDVIEKGSLGKNSKVLGLLRDMFQYNLSK